MYRSAIPNTTACIDDELVRIDFMDPENWERVALSQ